MSHTAVSPGRCHAHATRAFGLLFALLATPAAVAAQTDYYNTDAGRPITTEDAYSIERRALELQIAPLRLERANGGAYRWAVEPEVAVGILPRTQIEIGVPLAYVDRGTGGRLAGVAGAELSILHNLNVETSIPAFAVAADVLVPVGPFGPDKAYPSIKGIATRTFSWARFHVNARYTLGNEDAGNSTTELSRWRGGVAVDRTFPLESLLLTVEAVARQPLAARQDVAWDGAAGVRYQLSPRVAADAGTGFRITGDDRGWFATFGAAVALGLPWSPGR